MGNVGAINGFLCRNRLSRETIDSRKAFRDATIIQDGRGLYILLVN